MVQLRPVAIIRMGEANFRVRAGFKLLSLCPFIHPPDASVGPAREVSHVAPQATRRERRADRKRATPMKEEEGVPAEECPPAGTAAGGRAPFGLVRGLPP